MSRKRYTPDQISGNLREVGVSLAQGQTAGQICRTLGITDQTFYRWRHECARPNINQAKRLKAIKHVKVHLYDFHYLLFMRSSRGSGSVSLSRSYPQFFLAWR